MMTALAVGFSSAATPPKALTGAVFSLLKIAVILPGQKPCLFT